MEHNYDSDFEPQERVQDSPDLLPTWNTWTTRSIVKALAGLLLTIPVVSMMLSLFWPMSSVTALVLFGIGIIVWAIFYQMEMEYRKLTPDRIR